MNDTEDRLLARIDARRALATVLTPRQREVVRRVSRLGQTYREAGLDLRISPERVRQLYFKAELLLRRRLRRPPAKLAPVGTPPPGFDRAAFLEHMRGVIARRKAEADAEFERDATELARMVRQEQQGATKPAAAELHAELVAEYKAQAAQAALAKPVKYVSPWSPAYTVHPGEPWPPPPPDLPPDLPLTAKRALGLLITAHDWPSLSVPTLGTYCTNCVFPWRTGNLSEAMRQLIAEIPPDARLSTQPFAVPAGYLGANFTGATASVRVIMESNGQMMRLDVTWDRAD